MLLGIAIVFFLLNSTGSENRLDEAEALKKVVGLYGGTVENSVVSGDEIIVGFLKEERKYRASVDRIFGEVAAMELIEKTGPSKSFDEEQAEEIAFVEVEGEIEETKYMKEQNEYEVRVADETQISILAISAETGEIRKISTEKLELDSDDGRQYYEIEIVNGNTEFELEINAANGSLMEFEQDDNDDDDDWDDDDNR